MMKLEEMYVDPITLDMIELCNKAHNEETVKKVYDLYQPLVDDLIPLLYGECTTDRKTYVNMLKMYVKTDVMSITFRFADKVYIFTNVDNSYWINRVTKEKYTSKELVSYFANDVIPTLFKREKDNEIGCMYRDGFNERVYELSEKFYIDIIAMQAKDDLLCIYYKYNTSEDYGPMQNYLKVMQVMTNDMKNAAKGGVNNDK